MSDARCYTCGASMERRESDGMVEYRCTGYPACKAVWHPADAETRLWRHEAHFHFDKLWRGRRAPMDREEAYVWLSETLAISRADTHFSMMSIVQCQRVLAALEVRIQIAKMNPRPAPNRVAKRRQYKRRRDEWCERRRTKNQGRGQ